MTTQQGGPLRAELLYPGYADLARDDYEAFLGRGSAGAFASAMGMDRLPFWTRLSDHPACDHFRQDQENNYGARLGPLDWGGRTADWFRAHVLVPCLDAHLRQDPPRLDQDIARVTTFASGENRWERLPDWAAPGGSTLALRFGAHGMLSTESPQVAGPASASITGRRR